MDKIGFSVVSISSYSLILKASSVVPVSLWAFTNLKHNEIIRIPNETNADELLDY